MTPLLASQLGQPVSLGGRGQLGQPVNLGGRGHGRGNNQIAAAQLMAQALPQLAAVPTGDGKVVARNVNGTCK